MCCNFKTLLLKNDQIFILISNNQTLLDMYDYQASISTTFPWESWIEEIQCKRTIQFLFRDKRSFVQSVFDGEHHTSSFEKSSL